MISKVPQLMSQTLAGQLSSAKAVLFSNTLFPELSRGKCMRKSFVQVVDMKSRYNMILGRDVINQLGLILDFKEKMVQWDKDFIPMRAKSDINEHSSRHKLRETLVDDLHFCNDAANDADLFLLAVAEIKDADYHKVQIDEVISKCTHLNEVQRAELASLLNKHTILFNGELGKYLHAKVHLDIESHAKPVHRWHYPGPHIHYATFKKELERLVAIGVLEEAAPTFIIPKKDGMVRWVLSNFHGLNKVIKRKINPLPKIGDILARRTGYQFFSKIDVSMQYYTFELDDKSAKLCTIATPFGLYRYRRLPMRVN
jgi:hypothetical protein